MAAPRIFGILNITSDSFSDGGRYLNADDALAHAAKLLDDGADVIDIGASASNPDAEVVPPEDEIARLEPVVRALKARKASISIDTFSAATQRWAIAQDVDWLNDIQGFPDPALYDELARSHVGLVVMHNIAPRGQARRIDTNPSTIFDHLFRFFDDRIAALEAAGIARSRMVIDPGMGFFLGVDPEVSLAVLRRLDEIKNRYRLPLMISVSRKSFIRKLADVDVTDAGPATLAAELFAASQGADYLRTHDAKAFKHAFAVWSALQTGRKP
jgi:dihydropteroate synthase type 2